MRKSAVSLVLLCPLVLAADYQAGLDAFNEGDYANAMREWREVTDGAPTAVSPGIFIESHYAVAMLYWEGRGVPRDYSAAHDWLLQAANLGHAGAQVKLGYLYIDGRGVERDEERAFHWFGKAAKQGDVDGLYNLGVCYLRGWGTEVNETMAKQYLASASALGDEAAERALGELMGGANPPSGTKAGVHQGPEPTPPSALIADAGWILDRPPDRYTIQVIALSALDRIEELVEGHADLAPFAVYTVQRGGQPLYVLVQGDYPDVDAARKARDDFPRTIQRTDALWIRQFGMVQAAIEP